MQLRITLLNTIDAVKNNTTKYYSTIREDLTQDSWLTIFKDSDCVGQAILKIWLKHYIINLFIIMTIMCILRAIKSYEV